MHHPLTIGCKVAAVYNRFYSGEDSIERGEDNSTPGHIATESASYLLNCHVTGQVRELLSNTNNINSTKLFKDHILLSLHWQ